MKVTLTNTQQLKELNVDTIRRLLRCHTKVTKNDLANLSGLSVATCGNILRDMVETEEAYEIEQAKSTGGRPAKTYLLNKDFHHLAALYARRENRQLTLTYQVTNLIGEIISEQTKALDDITIDLLSRSIDQVLSTHPSIHSFAIGLPGVIRDGYVSSCDIVSLGGIELRDHLTSRYDLDFVVENDVNATVLGFYNRLQDNKNQSTVYIYYPSSDCLGSGIIINGQILYGKSNYAGEAGFLPFSDYNGTSDLAKDNPSLFAAQAAKTLMAYICIINPDNMVISGYNISAEIVATIKDELNKLCAQEHQPHLHFEADIKESYLLGLRKLAMDQLGNHLLVEEITRL